jgi:hypothetical protein
MNILDVPGAMERKKAAGLCACFDHLFVGLGQRCGVPSYPAGTLRLLRCPVNYRLLRDTPAFYFRY